jgi:hypothetical protein
MIERVEGVEPSSACRVSSRVSSIDENSKLPVHGNGGEVDSLSSRTRRSIEYECREWIGVEEEEMGEWLNC